MFVAETPDDWCAFREAIFGAPYSVWECGADFTELRRRWAADPLLVEEQLSQGLTRRDPLAADASAALDWHPEARERVVSALVRHVGAEPVAFHLRIAVALLALTGEPGWTSEISRVLSGAGFWGDRLEAAVTVSRLTPTCATVHALGAAVCDPDSLVRRQAVVGLITATALAPDSHEARESLRAVRSGTAPSDWARTATALTVGALHAVS